jgi:hypothetical protein
VTTLNLQAGASSDDAHETAGGTVILTDAYPALVVSGAHFGFRFLNATIPPGPTINTATIQTYNHSTSYDGIHCNIYCEDVDSASTFTASTNNIEGRSRTTASVSWSQDSAGTGWKTSPDISSAVQEVVDRAGWSSGNSVATLLDLTSGASWQIRMWDYDSSYAPKLDIDYTPPATGGQPMALRGQAVPGLRPWARAGRL